MAVVVVTGSGFVFLPPGPCTTSHLPEVCLFDSGEPESTAIDTAGPAPSPAMTREAGDVESQREKA
jgi:hypothetical protein